MTPSTFCFTRKHRLLWGTMKFLDEHCFLGPVALYKRDAVVKVADRKLTIIEHEAADLWRDYFTIEGEYVVEAGGEEPLRDLQEDIRQVWEASVETAARQYRAWVKSYLPRKARRRPKDTFDAKVHEYFSRFAAMKVQEITETSRKKIRRQLSIATAEGESVQEIATRLDKLYLEDIIPNRSMTIARTESGAAANWASHAEAEATGYVKTKEWLTNKDGRERDTHAEADGQIVPIDDQFVVGSARLGYPNDPSGPAEEIINCRCTMLYHT